MAYGKSQLERPEIVRLELAPPPKEVVALLKHTSDQLRRVANLCARTWVGYHDRRQTVLRLSAGVPAICCPPDLCARFLREAQALCPDVHCATILAVTNWLAQTWKTQNSPKINGKRWMAVLRGDESHWTYQYPLPIRLWSGNAEMQRDEDGRPCVAVRLDRIESGGKRASSTRHVLRFRIPTAGNRNASARLAYLMAAEIADGKRRLSQSQIFAAAGKWMLSLTVEGSAPAGNAIRDANSLFVIRPGRRSALRMRATQGGRAMAGGFGEALLDRVSRERGELDRRRREIIAAKGMIPKKVSVYFSDKWRGSSSAICDLLVAEVRRALEQRTFGKVLWLDGNNRTSALALAGREDQSDRRELFPFERLRSKATRALEKIGIEVVGRANFRSAKRRRQEHVKRVTASGDEKQVAKTARRATPLANAVAGIGGARSYEDAVSAGQ